MRYFSSQYEDILILCTLLMMTVNITMQVILFVCEQEEHAISELEKMELLTQARTTAAVTLEKAKHLEDTKDLQIQVQLHAFEHRKRVDMLEELLRQNCYFLQFFSLAFYSLIANWRPKGFQV